MVQPSGLGITWNGFLAEPTNSEWTKETIRGYAKEGWEQTQNTGQQDWTLVAALWVPRNGVYLGSIPHARPGAFEDDEHVEIAFESLADNLAPVMWRHAESRSTGADQRSETRFHAEHMALLTYEMKAKPKDRYPNDCFIAVYGQYSRFDNLGPKRPCQSGNYAPSCSILLRALDIDTQ